MSRMKPLLTIVGIAVFVVCAGIIGLRMPKSRLPSDRAADAAQAHRREVPFRSVVAELTFQSRSLDDGVETLSATGHRTEYIDVTGGRRREDYSSDSTIVGGQLPSHQSVSWIFDGTHFYLWIEKDGERANRVAEIREGFDAPIWADAAVEELKLPGATITTEEFLGRPCKVYTISGGTGTRKWWVWNGVTLRSESHSEMMGTVDDKSEEAVRVEENADIDPGLFMQPNDVAFEAVKPAAPVPGQERAAPWVRTGPEIDSLALTAVLRGQNARK